METKKFIDKLAWIRIVDRKILCTLSKGKDTYYLPGGKREANETDHQALIREIREELSVSLIPETIRPAGEFEAQAHGKEEGTLVHMTCFTADYRGELVPAAEIASFAWLTYADRDKCSPVVQIIFDDLKEKGWISA